MLKRIFLHLLEIYSLLVRQRAIGKTIRLSVMVLVLLMPCPFVSAQTGNDWIDYDQVYLKIKTGKDDLYRVEYEALLNMGFPIEGVNPDYFQLYHRGRQVAIEVMDNNDGSFDAGDYLDFFGQRNDGVSDVELFDEPRDQIHQYYNLFSDTTAFFLTISTSQPGKRIPLSDLSMEGLEVRTSHQEEILKVYTSEFSFGQYYPIGNPQGETKLSKYDAGQMFVSDTIMRNEFTLRSGKTFRDFIIDDIRLPVTGDGKPRLEVQVVGFNNRQHNVSIHVGPDTENLRMVKRDLRFNFSNNIKPETQIEWTDVSAQGRLVVRVEAVGFPEIPDDRVAVGYIQLDYPQETDMQSADEKFLYLPPASAGNNQLVEIENVQGTIAVYDITDYLNPVKLSVTMDGNSGFVVLAENQVSRKLLVRRTDETASVKRLLRPKLENVSFRFKEVSGRNYIIISHSFLRSCVGCVYEDPVQAYIDYRGSAAGGGYNVLYADINELFNEFNYGEFSPLAIRRFMEYIYLKGEPEYLFLIGKSRRVDNQIQRLPNPLVVSLKDLVPTMGAPGSDILFTEGLSGVPHYPAFPVGRLSVSQPQNVGYYLDKVIEKEANLVDSPWTKNFIQLSGGLSSSQLVRFRQLIEGFRDQVRGDFLGANVTNISKQTNNAVQKFNISQEVNKGVGFITFFGHSSSVFTDIDIGTVTDPANGYDNKGRYPAFLVNGCRGGEIFFRSSFGEDWIGARDKGAVSYMAHSDIGLAATLSAYTTSFYELLADTLWMTRSVGEIQQEAIARFLDTPFLDESRKSTAEQTVLQGDPAIQLFGHSKVDYIVRPEDIFLQSTDGREITAATTFFELGVVVNNGGRTTRSPLTVRVKRQIEDSTVMDLPVVELPPVAFRDTIFYEISNLGVDAFGKNTFEVILDSENLVDEGSEINNIAERSFTLPATGTFNTKPANFALVNQTRQRLVVQSANLRLNDKAFLVELDTTNEFNSPWKQNSRLLGKGVGNWDVTLLPADFKDTVQYYWRSIFEDELLVEPAPWNNSTFTFIRNGPSGWGQTTFDQFEELNLSSVRKDEGAGMWIFAGTETSLEVVTFGADHPNGNRASSVIVSINGDQQIPANPCGLNTLNAIAFDKDSGQPYFVLQTDGAFDIQDPLKCGKSVSTINTFRDDHLSDIDVSPNESLINQYINGINPGDSVLVFSVGRLSYADWRADVVADLGRIGISPFTIRGLQSGEPFIAFGAKGSSEGAARTVIGVPAGAEDNARNTRVELKATIVASTDSGTVESPVIGPASNWGMLRKRIIEEPAEDQVTFEVRGVEINGTQTVLFPNVITGELDLSGIDAERFPYVRLYLNMEDRISATPAQPDKWTVSFTGVPEGIISLQNEQNQNVDLQEGEPFQAKFKFTNISAHDFAGPLPVRYTFVNQTTNQESVETIEIPAVAAGQEVDFSLPISTRGRIGLNDLEVFVNPGVQLEQYYNNNVIRLNSFFNVVRDEINPNIDVTFDGVYIMDGDIISPSPLISIELRDNNPYLLKTEANGVAIKLGSACDGCPLAPIDTAHPGLEIIPATENSNFRIDFRPEFAEDGLYRLQVEVADASGNQSGILPYEITFEVISSSTITHFYPYPNPFSTSTRFVFTLTGNEIPDLIKIQIFTVSGKLVREITQDELGPIRIGNNITDFAWDGRDEYGDQLANGTYLYRVLVGSTSGTAFDRRRVGSVDSRAFNNNFGKLVILR